MTGNEHDAEDLVQETFLRAYKQINRFDGRAAFSTWLYRICSNCSLDLLRAKKNRSETQPAHPEEKTSWLDRLAAPGPGPDRLTESSQMAEMLGPAMSRLTDMERTAFILRHYEGCDIEQIACILGVHQNAAKHSVFRAVQKLRRELQPAWGAPR
jgi:RNA polymerase sigma-70 factor (ECF subfamily)